MSRDHLPEKTALVPDKRAARAVERPPWTQTASYPTVRARVIEFSTSEPPAEPRYEAPRWEGYTIDVLRNQADRLSQTADASIQATTEAQRLALECVTRRRYDEMVRLIMVGLGAFGLGLGTGAAIIRAMS
ncbi:MAG: hypothetical protein B7733_20345 [Myxococcales bacterium FL481]|nr:MAG: hypothetical protein B7733_20345 [Myxococcales bacterium FL481]